MANALQVSNEDSDLYNVLDRSMESVNPFIYAMNDSVGSYVDHPTAAVVRSGGSSSSIEVDIPKSALLTSLWVKVELGSAGRMRSYAPLAAFSSITLRTRTNEISTLTPHAILDWVSQQSAEYRALMQSSNHMKYSDVDAAGVAETSYYFPLPFPHFLKMNNHLDTKICEPMIVRYNLAPFTDWCQDGVALGVGSTIKVTTNFAFRSLNESQKNQFYSALSSKGDRGVARLLTNTATQVYRPTEAVDEHVIKIDRKFPTVRMRFDYSRTSGADAVGWRGPLDHSTLNFVSIDFRAGGVSYFKMMTQEIRMLLEQSVDGEMASVHEGAVGVAADVGRPLVIPEHLIKNIFQQTGFKSLRNLSDPEVVIKMDAAAVVATDRITITSVYYQEESIEPSDGTITTTVLS